MSELIIRRERGFAVPQTQAAGKTEKTEAGAQTPRPAAAGVTLSETLRQLIDEQTASRSRESGRTLRMGEAVLDEVQEKLSRMEELAREAAGGGEVDRDALQTELERLKEDVSRMMELASAGDRALFLDEEGAVDSGAMLYAVMGESTLPDWLLKGLTQGIPSAGQLLASLGLDRTASGAELLAAVSRMPLEGSVGRLAALYLGSVISGSSESGDTAAALEGLRMLLEKVAEGVPADQAVETLTGGAFTGLEDFQNQFMGGTAPGLEAFLVNLLLSGEVELPSMEAPLLGLLAGMEGASLELLMGLLPTASQSPEDLPEPADSAGPELSEAVQGPEEEVSVLEAGGVRVTGRDLSGVTFDGAAGQLTIGGGADVVLQGTGEKTVLVLTGTGTVTLQGVKAAALVVDAAGTGGAAPDAGGAARTARILTAGENILGTLELRTSVTLGGRGLLRLDGLEGRESAVLHLTGGAVEVKEGEGRVTVPVVIEGAASLAARAAAVTNAQGKPLDALDLLWRTFLPGWSSLTSLTADGRRLALAEDRVPDLLRLWMEKGERGYPGHSLVLQGRDRAGQPRTRYAYLHWYRRAGTFQELGEYPNPFTITGGEESRDWAYEEATQTLHILTDQVTAVSGGVGAGETPFSGRLALADRIGSVELALGGVSCRVAAGRAFQLGRRNDVKLLLQRGSQNRFESGAGCAGISLGEGTSLRVDAQSGSGSLGTLTASGGAGGAGIGRDSGGGRDQTSRIVICGGEITASGAGGGAGVGGGRHGAMGPVTVLGGKLTASGEAGGAGIGGGLDGPVGDITIQGGVVSAQAAWNAAAIGAGVRGESGDILITGTARIAKAQGGNPGADIGGCLFGGCGKVLITGGADTGGAKLWTKTGISLQMGEATATLPQFRLSVRTLRLEGLRLSTRETARAAALTLTADRRWVDRIQTAYRGLYSQLEGSGGVLAGPMRDAGAAGNLLRDMERSLRSAQATLTHSGGSGEDIWQLLW